MIADDRAQVLIGTPTKTGTHSLEAIARKAEKHGDELRLVRWPGSKIPRHHHMLVPADCIRYQRLLTVRHPLDRLASLYFWLNRWPWQWKSRAAEFTEMSLDTFARWWVEERHHAGFNGGLRPEMIEFNFWRSPNIWLVTMSECFEAFTPHGVLRLEYLERDLHQKIKGRDWDVPHVNKSRPNGDNWRDVYKPSTITMLAEGDLKDDLKRFKYHVGKK